MRDAIVRIGARRLDIQLACELVQGLEIVRLDEEVDQFLDQCRADAVDIIQLRRASGSPAVSSSIAARQRSKLP